MKYPVAIPSYDRVDTLKNKTLAMLERHKIPREQITIFVSGAEQYKLYTKALPDYRIVRTPSENILETRNYITDYYEEGEKVVHIDDDVEEVLRKVHAEKTSREMVVMDLTELCDMGFAEIEKRGLSMWGINPVPNPFFLTHNTSQDLRYVVAALRGVINHRDIILSLHPQKEDVENTIRAYIRDGGVLRYNYITISTKWYAPGGICAQSAANSARGRKELSKAAVDQLAAAFPDYGKAVQRPSGIWEFKLHKKPKAAEAMEVPQEVAEEYIEEFEIRDHAAYEVAREALLTELRKITIPKIQKSHYTKAGVLVPQRDRIIGTIGRTCNFGFGRTRHGYKEYVTNKKYPDVFKALVAFSNVVLPRNWTYQSITLNHNVQAKKHIDGQNNGHSVIVGIGEYTGGRLNVYDKDGIDVISYDIKDRPLMFNGAINPHETLPFEGERYTIIFFKQKKAGTIEGMQLGGL